MEDPLADVLSQVVMQESAGGDIDEVGCIDVLGDVGTTVPAIGFYLHSCEDLNASARSHSCAFCARMEIR